MVSLLSIIGVPFERRGFLHRGQGYLVTKKETPILSHVEAEHLPSLGVVDRQKRDRGSCVLPLHLVHPEGGHDGELLKEGT